MGKHGHGGYLVILCENVAAGEFSNVWSGRLRGRMLWISSCCVLGFKTGGWEIAGDWG